MARQTGLIRRGARWYIRVAIPTDIKSTYGKTEEKCSLGTSDYQEALKLLPQARAKIERLFEEHRRWLKAQAQPFVKELSQEEIRKVGEVYYAHLLQEDEDTRNEGFYEGEELELPALTFEERIDKVEALENVDKYNQARGKVGAFYQGEAGEVLSWANVDIRLDPSSPSMKAVARELQKASLRAAKAIKERNEGEVVETPITEGPTPYSLTPHLSQARDEWFKMKAREGTWSNPRTVKQYQTWTDLFLTLIGDRPINQYTKADGRKFRDVVSSLPKNRSKYKELKGLPLDSTIKKAHELGLDTMSKSNVNKYILGVSALWRWVEKNYDEEPSNPLDGMEYGVKRNPRDERNPFTLAELNAIFHAPIFTGCKSYHQWKKPGDLVLCDSYRYWALLIGLLTGARLGEICQMGIEDIKEEQGILYFDIHADRENMSLKNAQSKRKIPVHTELIKLGLMQYIQRVKANGEESLFPDLKMSSEGYRSKNATAYYNKFFEAIVVKHDKNCFHSFRHNFQDACRDSNIPHELIEALQGHKGNGMAARYGNGFRLSKLSEDMDRLQYRGLDLSHLYQQG